MREEHSLRVFEKRVMRKGFGPERDEVRVEWTGLRNEWTGLHNEWTGLHNEWTGLRNEWTGLHNEELYDLYCSPNIIHVIQSRMKWARYMARMGEESGLRVFCAEN
jgi:hypothetical protein